MQGNMIQETLNLTLGYTTEGSLNVYSFFKSKKKATNDKMM